MQYNHIFSQRNKASKRAVGMDVGGAGQNLRKRKGVGNIRGLGTLSQIRKQFFFHIIKQKSLLCFAPPKTIIPYSKNQMLFIAKHDLVAMRTVFGKHIILSLAYMNMVHETINPRISTLHFMDIVNLMKLRIQ